MEEERVYNELSHASVALAPTPGATPTGPGHAHAVQVHRTRTVSSPVPVVGGLNVSGPSPQSAASIPSTSRPLSPGTKFYAFYQGMPTANLYKNSSLLNRYIIYTNKFLWYGQFFFNIPLAKFIQVHTVIGQNYHENIKRILSSCVSVIVLSDLTLPVLYLILQKLSTKT